MNAFLLELLNGLAVAPEIFCLVLLSLYLSREARRRGLRRFDWLKLPPSMNLVFAIFVFDIGSCTRSIASWSWRHFYGTDTANTQINLMWAFGGILVIVGALCKIRALTYPDHGNRPWLASAGLTAIVLLGLILWH